jgi:aldehyde:ferredoxin oxidoreductase
LQEACNRIGKGASELAAITKGMDYPAHDPRGHFSMAINYATSVRGACHLEALSYFLDRGILLPDLGYDKPSDQFRQDDKPKIIFDLQNYMSIFNALGLCKFLFHGGVGPSDMSMWLKKTLGFDTDTQQLMKVGERIFNLKRIYDIRLGISRKDDILPSKLMTPKPDGRASGRVPDVEKMLNAYYKIRQWDENGVPTIKLLKKLEIKDELIRRFKK